MSRTGDASDWDASTYDSLPLPHERWGRGVLAGLELHGDERVLDAGAGTGRDTAALLARLPRGHVIAVDGSPSMLDQLRERLSDVDPERLTVLAGDLGAPLELEKPVDAVFSVATLHWIADHDAAFRSLAGELRRGGVLRAEWGGPGNVANVESALAHLGLPAIGEQCNFATVEQTERRLIATGFTDVEVVSVPDPARMRTREQLESFLRTVVLKGVLEQASAEEGRKIASDVADRLREPTVDYVRLRAAARLK